MWPPVRRGRRDLGAQVASYSASIEEQVRNGNGGGGARALLGQIDRQVREARGLEASGQLEEAKRKMTDAYRWASRPIERRRPPESAGRS